MVPVVLAAASEWLGCHVHPPARSRPAAFGRARHSSLQHSGMGNQVLSNPSDPACMPDCERSLGVFLARPGRMRVRVFTFDGQSRHIRHRARNLWVGQIEWKQLDGKRRSVGHGAVPLVQPVLQHQELAIDEI